MRANPVDVCIIEDDRDQLALLVQRMRSGGYTVVEAANAETGLVEIGRHHPRVVICDLMLPGMDGIELCRRIRGDPALSDTYVVIVTASEDRSANPRALSAGADDCQKKPYDYDELNARLRNGLRISKLQEHLRHAALTDGLTKLWNHTQFRELLTREYARTRRYGGVAALLMADLDHFKAVNDAYGHEVGNQVLQGVARELLRLVRDTDIVARYGGEEFAVICPETNLDDAARLAERIRRAVPQHVRIERYAELTVTISIGVSATSDSAVTSMNELISRADHALYRGKRTGRNQVVRCDAVNEKLSKSGVEVGEVDWLQKQVISLSMQAKELCLQSVWALVQALEARDQYTAWHSRNTTFYATALAETAGWPQNLRTTLANAAMLHDLGKIGVPDEVLQCPTNLTEEQAAVLRQVPLLTCKILEPLRVFETETLIIRHVRERFDGSGYPFGLVGTAIPLGSRLLAVAETFDALTSKRPHRPSRSIAAAMAVIRAEAGKQFDPAFVALLEGVVAKQRARWQARIRRCEAALRAATAAVPPPGRAGK